MPTDGRIDDTGVQRIADLQQRLEKRASTATREWWERYLRGTASFRGVRMGAVRAELHSWYEANGLERVALAGQVNCALTLLREPETEDKLAGMLFFQEILLPGGNPGWKELVPEFRSLFEEGHLADWNSVDWFCVKVLGPLVTRDGEPCTRAVAGWRTGETLWQRRASAVTFVNLVRRGELFPGFLEMVLESCHALVASPERFSQTGAGWVLREVSRADAGLVERFVRSNASRMSREAVVNATKKLPDDVRSALLSRHRSGLTPR